MNLLCSHLPVMVVFLNFSKKILRQLAFNEIIQLCPGCIFMSTNINKTLNDSGNIDTTKNNSSNRTIPLFDPTIKVLKYIL